MAGEVSRERARNIVEDIMSSHGGITAADMAATPPQVLRSLARLRESFAKTTTILSKQLYTKDTRFMYELIQNAEDTSFDLAQAEGERPSLIFTVTPDHILVDSNEDGFNEANVRAICKMGGTTKIASRGYIGEKGIGFKSVFKIASRVRVQSGPFCFAFEHGDDDPGLGMVTPINDDHEELPENVRTRFELTLNDHSSYESRISELKSLPDTLLLFLTKLKKLVIRISNGGEVSNIVYKYSYNEVSRLGTVRKIESLATSSTEKIRQYYMERRSFGNLPTDEVRPDINEAEAVLAFPVDGNGEPVLEQQHVFAFLPMREVGFTFQIQSDFITQATREDLFDSAWNRALLDEIAQTFCRAMLRFRIWHSLEFTWLRYLPSRNIPDPFWASLRRLIFGYLAEERLLQSWNAGTLEQGRNLRRVPPDCLDANTEPLFDCELSGLEYLSREYSVNDWELLVALDVRTLSEKEFCHIVSMDLVSQSSKMKSELSTDDWHTRTSQKLSAIAKSNAPLVQSLKCIPLQDGTWISASEGPIYFPDHSGILVPIDLGLRLIRREALTNKSRRALFSELGVKICSRKTINSQILRRYSTGAVDLQSSVSHLRWLYHFLPEGERVLDRRVPIIASDGVPTYRVFVTIGKELRVDDLYFESDDEFGVKKLCPRKFASFGKGSLHNVHFINGAYLTAVASTVTVKEVTWLRWLEACAAVRKVPRLVHAGNPSQLSALFSSVVLNRPEQVVGTLHAHWSSYKDQMKPEIISVLRRAKVIRNWQKETELEATWLPTQDLLQICKDFKLIDRMPFLKLPMELNPDNQEDWKFLVQFGVGFEANTNFYLKILEVLKISNEIDSEVTTQHYLKAYEAIEKNSNSSTFDEITEFFADGEFLLLPSLASGKATWTKPDYCLWNAPDFIDYCHVLGSRDEYRDNRSIKHLFTDILGIEDISGEHYVQQLESWKDGKSEVENIAGVYSHISQSLISDEEIDSIRESFESESLIYVPSQREWFPPSTCMWLKSTMIASNVAIASEFPHLEDFFTRKLGVQKADKTTYVRELESLCNIDPNPPISRVKQLLLEINSWQPNKNDLARLKPLNILPVKESEGKLKLKNVKDAFVLFDRKDHAEIFEGKVAYLDFSMEAQRHLRPLISALGLNTRYTSVLVKQDSRAQHAVPEPTLSRNLRLRAYAIFRCAVHYQESGATPHEDALYQRLLHVEVSLSDSISNTISLILNEKIIASESTHGVLHLHDSEDHIRLYLPRDKKKQELSYLTQVPERFVSYFGIKDPGAAKVFGDVLKSSLNVLDDVLTSHGIVLVPGVAAQPPPDNETSASSVGSVGDLPIANLRPSTPSSASNTVVEDVTLSTASVTDVSGVRAQSVPFARAAVPSTQPAFTWENVSEARVNPSDEKYRALLDHVIQSAGSDRQNLSFSDEPFLSDEVFGVRATNQLLHDMKIGAAGELYAFEFLSNFIPLLSRTHWKSNIRKFVRVHEKYSDMSSYDGPETADIVYQDIDGDLTDYLIRCHLLDAEIWDGMTPKYFLEVKTTTQECGTRFFMSKAQVQRAERMVIPPGRAALEVYMILRVSNLGPGEIDLDFFVDPETLRRQGRLRFEAESYTVLQAGTS